MEWEDRFLYAPPEERRAVLLAFGFSAADIARVVTGSDTRAHHDAGASDAPSSEHDRVNDVGAILGYAVVSTSDEAGLVAWFRAANAHLGGRSPLDVLGDGDFHAVRDAWWLDVEIVFVDDPAVRSIPTRTPRRLLSWPHGYPSAPLSCLLVGLLVLVLAGRVRGRVRGRRVTY